MRASLIMAVAVLACGCTFRGIPTHGGGKRFDTEQHLLTQAIKQVVDAVDLTALKDKRVNVVVVAIGDAGSGNINMGGFDPSMVYQYLNNWDASKLHRSTVGDQTTDNRTTNISKQSNWSDVRETLEPKAHQFKGVGALYGRSLYTSDGYANERDMDYLAGYFYKHCYLNGINVVAKGDVDVDLFVLVDVFGTNRYRWESIAYNTENLVASCKLTYFAISRKGTQVEIPETACSSRVKYQENYLFGAGPLWTDITLEKPFEDIAEMRVRKYAYTRGTGAVVRNNERSEAVTVSDSHRSLSVIEPFGE